MLAMSGSSRIRKKIQFNHPQISQNTEEEGRIEDTVGISMAQVNESFVAVGSLQYQSGEVLIFGKIKRDILKRMI